MRDAVAIVPTLPVCANGEALVVRDVVPDGFPAVVAILHESRRDRVPTAWRIIAERLGIPFNPRYQWALLRERGGSLNEPVRHPRAGSLNVREAERLVDHLRSLGLEAD